MLRFVCTDVLPVGVSACLVEGPDDAVVLVAPDATAAHIVEALNEIVPTTLGAEWHRLGAGR